MDEDDLPEGEMVTIDAEFDDVEDTPDGGAIVRISDDEDDPEEGEFYDNLAETMPESELQTLASRFLDLVSKDKEARKKRDEQYEEGLKRTGLGDDAPGGAEFQGASRVVHPMMTEACVDFTARIMKEIFPPGGPAKDLISGDTKPDRIEKAERKVRLLNWQMTAQCPEVRSELEQLMTQVPLGGTQYLKLGWDNERNRPTFLFVPVDEMYLPYAATNFYTAQRKTHVQYITQLDYEERVKSGMYRDVDLIPASMEPEQSQSAKANDKIEGRDASSYNDDGLRIVFEIAAIADIEGDGAAPYLISVDKVTGRVLSIYRNWEEDDASKEALTWFIEFPFIPWRGAYAIGFPHIIGGLSGAATGALRALLDSAHINNSQTMLRLKGGISGQSLTIQPGQTAELEGSPSVDDIRKLAMPLPYNPPNPVLFSLLGFLVDAGRSVISASLEDVSDGNPNAPVGTTLAKLEQGSVIYSSIHARMHDAMARMLRMLEKLNGLYLDDEALQAEAGEALASREDFDGVLDVVPVSDPNIFSEAQRYAQVQAIAQRAQLLPQLYDARAVEERLLETLKIPNAKELLAPALEPKEQNAVNENVAASLGRPITAFPDQDHIAHLKTHLSFLASPAFGMNPLIAPSFLPVILNHIKEHIVLWYVASTVKVTSDALGEDVGALMRELEEEPEARPDLDRLLAEAATMVIEQGAQTFDALPQIIAQAQQMLAQMTQPGAAPPDPFIALETQKIQQKAQSDQQDAAIETQKIQARMKESADQLAFDQQELSVKTQIERDKLALDQQAEAADAQVDAADLQARLAMNDADNQTAKEITAVKIAAGQPGGMPGLNPNP